MTTIVKAGKFSEPQLTFHFSNLSHRAESRCQISDLAKGFFKEQEDKSKEYCVFYHSGHGGAPLCTADTAIFLP